jgi:tetratricopeptide (TPR) repeat protein
MAFEKAKYLRAAEKFLSQGKIPAAIKEYRQIVDRDENDFTTLNMLGDLYVRAGEKEQAISCFLRIAEHYGEQGFTLKAIAMYKKIDRLRPRNPQIANKLAALYAVNGLVVDARAQYLIVADACSKAGETRKALEVFHKIADLDPQNTEVRLKLAEGYFQEGLMPQAAEAFTETGKRLFGSGSFEKSLQVFSRSLELVPFNQPALKGLLSASIALGAADEAAEVLERAVEKSPADVELISMLANAYLEADDPQGAERAAVMLLSQDASNYTRFIDVARLYLKTGDISAAVRLLMGITEQMLAGRQENDLLEIVNEVLARDPEQIGALRLLSKIHWWQRDTEKLRSGLERLAEAAEAAGLADDERYALTQLVRLAPEETLYLERLNALGGLQEDAPEEAMPYESPSTEVPTFEGFAIMKEEAGGEPLASASEFEWNTVESEAVSDPNASFADLNVDVEDRSVSPEVSLFESSTGFQEVDFGASSQGVLGDQTPEASDSSRQTVRREGLMREELESVDFYITQGYVDIASDTLDVLERQFGQHQEIQARRQKLSAPGHAESVAQEVVRFESGDEFSVASGGGVALANVETADQARSNFGPPKSSTGTAAVTDPGLAEILEEFRAAAEEEPPVGSEDYETHYNLGFAYKEMDLLDEAIQEFQLAAGLAKPDEGTPRFLQCCNMLGHCFVQKGLPRAAVIWFQKGLKSPGNTEDEYLALQYELGSAYEQMADFERAIDAFTEVYGADVSYRNVGDKLRTLQQQQKDSKS